MTKLIKKLYGKNLAREIAFERSLAKILDKTYHNPTNEKI